MPIDLSDEIFTVEQAAQFAKVSEPKIRAWFDLGLKHFPTAATIGRTGPRMEIVRKSAILEFIAACEVGAPEHLAEPSTNARTARDRPAPVAAAADPHGLMSDRPRRNKRS